MRPVLRSLSVAVSLAAAFAAPARAQAVRQQMELDLRESQLRARENMIDRQMVAQQNQLSALDAQVRTQQALDDVRAQSLAPPVPSLRVGATIDPGQMASIPDDKLAASNERVRAVAANRH